MNSNHLGIFCSSLLTYALLAGCGRAPATEHATGLRLELLPPDSIQRSAGRMDRFRRTARRVRLRVGEAAKTLCDRTLDFPLKVADVAHCGLAGYVGKQLRLSANVTDVLGRNLADAGARFRVEGADTRESLVVKLVLRVPVSEFDGK